MTKKEKDAHNRAWEFFKSTNIIPKNAVRKDWVLHHKDVTLQLTNPERYKEWRIEDLIPMTKEEHRAFHNSLRVGELHPLFGKHHSEETKKKMSEKAKHMTDEHKRKLSESKKGKESPVKGRHWKLVDGKRVYYECTK